MIINGTYQLPGQAAKQAARLELQYDAASFTLALANGDGQAFRLDQVTISDAIGDVPRVITFPDGARFAPADNRQFTEWLALHDSPGLLHTLEKSKRGVLIALLGTLLFTVFFFRVLLPTGSAWVARGVPDSIAAQAGQETLYVLDKVSFNGSRLPQSRQRALQALFSDIQPEEIRAMSLPVSLKIRRAAQANAFTLADGSIVITDALVEMAENDHEIAAVMLHEMGHHYHRHVMHTLVQYSAVTVISAWVIGDAGGVADALINTGATMLVLNYSRDMEREADNFAIEQMKRQKRPLKNMLAIYERLDFESAEGDSKTAKMGWSLWSMFSSHPEMRERLAMIQDAMKNEER